MRNYLGLKPASIEATKTKPCERCGVDNKRLNNFDRDKTPFVILSYAERVISGVYVFSYSIVCEEPCDNDL